MLRYFIDILILYFLDYNNSYVTIRHYVVIAFTNLEDEYS